MICVAQSGELRGAVYVVVCAAQSRHRCGGLCARGAAALTHPRSAGDLRRHALASTRNCRQVVARHSHRPPQPAGRSAETAADSDGLMKRFPRRQQISLINGNWSQRKWRPALLREGLQSAGTYVTHRMLALRAP